MAGVKTVRCIDASGFEQALSFGKLYEVSKENENYYYIFNDFGASRSGYKRHRFVEHPEKIVPLNKPKVYLIGSLRNVQVTRVAALLRDVGFEVFDDWFAAGPTADDAWKEYEQARGRTYKEAMEGYAAKHVFEFDKKHIDEADIGVMLLPAGKSGHAELGYMKGKGKKCIVYLESDVDRWDIMYNFFDSLVYSDVELIEALNANS